MRKNKKSQRGFTLIELMLVVAIIGALGAIVVPRFSVSQEAARTARVQADLRTIESAVVMYEADIGTLPTLLSQLTTAQLVGGRTYGPYLKSKPIPPAGTVRVTDADGKALVVDAAADYTIVSGRPVFNGTYTVENIR